MTIKITNNPTISLFIYWFILLVWQNLFVYSNTNQFTYLIKLSLIVFLIISMGHKKILVNETKMVIWLVFVLEALYLLFVRDTLSVSNIVYYIFPVVFSLLIFICNNSTSISLSEYKRFLFLVVLASLIMALYALFFQTNQLLGVFGLSSAYGYELKSFFISNHEYGMYLTFGIASTLFLYQEVEKDKRNTLVFIVVISLLGLNLIATISRTSIVACAVIVIIMLLLTKRTPVKKWFIVGVVILVLLFALSRSFQQFFQSVVLKGGNDADRFVMWRVSMQEFKESSLIEKLFGHGLGYVTDFAHQRFMHSSLHNSFVQVLMVWGVIGVIFLIGVILSAIFLSLKTIRINKNIGSIFLAFALSAIAFMFTNTACLLQSPIDSFMLTIFTIVVPRYVMNGLIKKQKE